LWKTLILCEELWNFGHYPSIWVEIEYALGSDHQNKLVQSEEQLYSSYWKPDV
jgi:hypothetical protein